MHGLPNLRMTESETSRELAVWQSKHSFYLVNLRVLDCHRQHTFNYWKFKLQWIRTKEMRFYFDISFSPYTPPIFLVSRRPKRPLDQKYKVCKRQKVNVKYFDISFVFLRKRGKEMGMIDNKTLGIGISCKEQLRSYGGKAFSQFIKPWVYW